MATVYLALGSNIGDSKTYLKAAMKLLEENLRGLKQAPIYRSRAAGYADQPDFLNTAVSGETGLDPESLLKFIKEAERKIGRRERFRHGPREIDIDIIFYGGAIRETEDLTIPHPAFRDRDFVLRPLCDLNPQLKDPVTGRTVRQLLDVLPPDTLFIVKQVD